MLVCRWASVNDLVQNKFRSIIHLLSYDLLAQSHRQKHQRNVQDLLKVNYKRHSSVFSVSIVDFELLRSRQVVRATVPKNGDISLLLFARNIDLLQSEVNSEPHLKWCFFAKIVYSLQSLTILTRSSIFRSVTWC